MEDEQPTRDDLQAVAALLPALMRVEAHPAEWRGGQRSSGHIAAVLRRLGELARE